MRVACLLVGVVILQDQQMCAVQDTDILTK